VTLNRLTKAKEFGADFTINSSKENLVERVREFTNDHGSDLTIVVVSSPKAQQDSTLTLDTYVAMRRFMIGCSISRWR